MGSGDRPNWKRSGDSDNLDREFNQLPNARADIEQGNFRTYFRMQQRKSTPKRAGAVPWVNFASAAEAVDDDRLIRTPAPGTC